MPLTRNALFRSSDAKITRLLNRLHKIRIFRNGDCKYKGHLFKFRKSNYRDMASLLDEISKEMQGSIFIHIGGIRGLYSLDGMEINSVDELVDGEPYVATCLSETFKNILYPVQSRTSLSTTSGTLIRTRSLSSLRRRSLSMNSATSIDYRGPVDKLFRPRFICVIQGDDARPRKAYRIHLNYTNATRLQTVFDKIDQQMTFEQDKPLDRVFMENCAEVRCLEDFFGTSFIFFAFPKMTLTWDMLGICGQEDVEIAELCDIPHSNAALMRNLPLAIKAQYRIRDAISDGGFSIVHECVEKSTNKRFALKAARKVKDSQFADCYLKQMKNEMNLLPELRHPNIVQIYLAEETNEALYSVKEFLDGGDLRDAITADNIQVEEYLSFMDNLASAMAYLHLRSIAHRDICPTNLLLRSGSGGRKLVLTDFHHATRVTEPLYDYCGFLMFMAPEILTRKGYGVKVDIWAAGVTLYVMVTKAMPFQEKYVDECMRRILKRPLSYADDDWDDVPDSIKVLTDMLLCRDVGHRMSAGEVLAFIANVRDGHYSQSEFRTYCDIEIPNGRRRRRRI